MVSNRSVDVRILDQSSRMARAVPVDSSSSRPGIRLSEISVPVALRPTRMVSPSSDLLQPRGQRPVGDLDREEFSSSS